MVLDARETRHCGFMLLIHKFSVNGARMSGHPPFLYPNLSPLSSPCPVSSRFLRSSAVTRLSFLHPLFSSISVFLRIFVLVVRFSFCEIARMFTRVSPGTGMTCTKKFPNLLILRPPSIGYVTSSISSDVLGKKAWYGGTLYPINLRVAGASLLSGETARLVTRIIEQYQRNYLFSRRFAISVGRSVSVAHE